MKIKYTSDGKKVSIVGKLNAKETIVQEIFVTEGDAEIPSGENFVVKSLHDAPVMSWQEKELPELRAKAQREYDQISHKIQQRKNAFYKEQKSIDLFLGNIYQTHKNFNTESFDTLRKFLNGEITHVVKANWHYEITTLEDVLDDSDYGTELKLLTLYGRVNGDMQWKINRYSDGSGCDTNIYPCTSIDEAKAIIEEKIIEDQGKRKRTTEEMIKAKNEYGLSVPTKEDIIAYNKKLLEDEEQNIKKIRLDLDNKMKEVEKIKALIN